MEKLCRCCERSHLTVARFYVSCLLSLFFPCNYGSSMAWGEVSVVCNKSFEFQARNELDLYW